MYALTCPDCGADRVSLVNEDSSAVYRCLKCGTYFDDSELDFTDHPRYNRTKPPKRWIDEERS
jgi:uncharacterized Zn finger protein